MPDSQSLGAEQGLQRRFRLAGLAAGLLLLAAIAIFDRWMVTLPNRVELGERVAEITVARVALPPGRRPGPTLAGAWEIRSDDPRFGGISALAVDGRRLIALTDSGTLIRIGLPVEGATRAVIRELPSGPGEGAFKRNRDSEALARDPQGRGWWVAFEYHDELWLYDASFSRALQRVRLGPVGAGDNNGIEGAATEGRSLLAFPESGSAVLRVGDGRLKRVSLSGLQGGVSEALAIGDRLFVIERRLTLLGFRNALLALEKTGRGYRVGGRTALDLHRTDNVEALAGELTAGGGIRLWLMTDNNYHKALRTKLVALDLPAQAAKGSAKSSR